VKGLGQLLRPSEFILSYGVGSIIDGKGPRLVPVFEKWNLSRVVFSGTGGTISQYRIDDRNTRAQLGGGEVFAIPTNARFDLPPARSLYRTLRFPLWALCQEHHFLYRQGTRGRSNCPQCRGRAYDAQGDAIRFVRACPDGHLDDVDWKGTIHGAKSCPGTTFQWDETSGSDLKSVVVRCRQCGSQASLLDIYYRTDNCSGYFPELEQFYACDESASVILRSATSLRYPEVVTSLTIPPAALPIRNVLSQRAIGEGILTLAEDSGRPKQKLLELLEDILGRHPERLDPETVAGVESTPEEDISEVVKDILHGDEGEKTPEEVKLEEFLALQHAAQYGYPQRPSSLPDFEVDINDVIPRLDHRGLAFRVTPVKRLRVVLAQRGYSRPVRGPTKEDSNGRKVPIPVVERYYFEDNKRWYPGVALKGEGIFIDLPGSAPPFNRERAAMWTEREQIAGASPNAYQYSPMFVWWHTLAHRLITALSLDSGYSSASIRERVYFRAAREGRREEGGILLYTSQEGADGSLGGLVAICQKPGQLFENLLSIAERDIDACSNDPLCSKHAGGDNGAACYACLLLAETSCEFHNRSLDRLHLAGTLT
jgi:MrfA Zn-binding domain